MIMADTSSYNQLTNQPSFMDKAAGFMGLLNSANQNRVAIGQREAGKAVQSAITPDGTVDNKLLMQGIQNNPLVAPAAQEAVQGAQAIQSNSQSITKQQFENATLKNNYLRETLGSLVADPSLDRKKIVGAVGKLVAQKILSPEMAAIELSNLPGDDKGMRSFLTNHLVNSMSATEKLNAAYGSANLVSGVGPSGEPVQNVARIPGLPENPTTVNGQPVGGAPPSPFGGQAQPQAAAPGAGGGGIVAGLPVGEAENLASSAKAYQDLRQDVSQAAPRIFALRKSLDNLAIADTGKNSGWYNDLKSFLITAAGPEIAEKIGANPDKVAAYDEAKKYLTSYAQQASSAFGSGTDNQLATALSANASTEISNLAAQDVVKASIALERMKQAQVALFDSLKQPANSFSGFATDWSQNVDPVAFSVDLMTPKARKAYFDGLSDEARARFRESVKIGIQTGVIDASALKGAKK